MRAPTVLDTEVGRFARYLFVEFKSRQPDSDLRYDEVFCLCGLLLSSTTPLTPGAFPAFIRQAYDVGIREMHAAVVRHQHRERLAAMATPKASRRLKPSGWRVLDGGHVRP